MELPVHVAVVVLGDVGRSPRMQYHAKSLADLVAGGRDVYVSLVGYEGEACVPDVQEHPRIRQYLFSPFTVKFPRSAFIISAPIKVIVLLFRLVSILLFTIPRADFFLVQNPPSIPTLAIVWVVARIYGAQLVIDWHNFGFTVLGQSRGERHPFVRISRSYEAFFARRADAHFSVTDAMRKWMLAEWGVEPKVLYDKAPHFFHETTVAERHELFGRLAEQLRPAAAALALGGGEGCTLFTDVKGALRHDRPALVVSSTSWTEDEDFGLLLAAIADLDASVKDDPAFPKVLFVVTGKGPLKQFYEEKMRKIALHKMHVCTMWLEPRDYPLLLGSADLGVCLHTSTSGLDLPMKVVDMFGCGLPVCAVGFQCLSELVRHGENGMVFSFSRELSEQLRELLRGVTETQGNARLKQLRNGVAGFERWQPNWKRNAAPLFLQPCRRPPALLVCVRFMVLIVVAALALRFAMDFAQYVVLSAGRLVGVLS